MQSDHIDVLIIGAGLSGIGAACHLQQKMSWKRLCHPRGPRLHRRDVGPVPLPGRALRFRHVHARLLVPAVDRRQSPSPMDNRSSITSARPRASTASIARSDSTTASGARHGRRRRRAGRWRRSAGSAARAAHFTCNFLIMCSGYYSYAEGYTPEFPGHRPLQGPHRPPSELDRRRRLRQQARGRDRQRRNRRHARAGAGEIGEPTSRCCSARRPTSSRGPTRTRIANALRRWLPATAACAHRALEERAGRHVLLSASASAIPSGPRP